VDDQWVDELSARLPRHGSLVRDLRDAIASDDRWRWFDVACSIGAGGGDEWSDIDSAVGYTDTLDVDEASNLAREVVTGVGDALDVLVHSMEGWPPELRRLAVEYRNGVQLDLVVMPARHMSGLRDREVAIVDKDSDLSGNATSQLYGPPEQAVVREWTMMAWWWVSDIAKYLERDSPFEAAERIALVRNEALKLFAAAHDVPYPSFGLTSLLDYEPFALPPTLTATYPVPADRASVIAAARSVAELLNECAHLATSHLGYNLATEWQTSALCRLEAATN
jgi:hypothetical protein